MCFTIGHIEDGKLLSKAVQPSLQCRWTRWENILQRDLSFNKIFKTSPRLLFFVLGSTYDTLASPSNKKRWGLTDDESCLLCSATKYTLRHILSACKVSLSSGRFRYRHDMVLKSICHTIQSHINQINMSKQPVRNVQFVKAGSATASCKKCFGDGILSRANN